jgi:hypothetical protein
MGSPCQTAPPRSEIRNDLPSPPDRTGQKTFSISPKFKRIFAPGLIRAR